MRDPTDGRLHHARIGASRLSCRATLYLFAVCSSFSACGHVAFGFLYYKYAMMIEDKFGGGAIRTNSSVYAMPRRWSKATI